MSVAIYTITHTPFDPPSDSIYIPLQAGAALHEHYGYLCDDTGDNISEKNPYYSELTGLYWIWKNSADADYIGLCHYRRYFLNQNGSLMTEKDYVDILSNYDVIVSKSQMGEYDYRTVYGRSHDIHNLELAGETIRSLYPEYAAAFEETMSDHRCYVGNLFAAPRELFCAYAKWLFDIFFAMEPLIQADHYDDYHKRLFGFLSEQLLIVWVRHNQLSYYEAAFGLTQEKAETLSLKKELNHYIQNKDIDNAYQCLHDTLNRRPDLLLVLSDFQQELTIAEHIINICRIERETDVFTLLDFSNDLSILTKHFHLLVSILEKIQNECVTEEELKYLIDCRVSHKALLYIMQNFKQFKTDPIPLLNRLAVTYTDAKQPLTALYFLEEALSLNEQNKITLTNIVTVMQQLEQPEMAYEYQQVIDNLPKRIAVFTGSDIPILNYICSQYITAFETLGHTVFVFDKRDFEHSFHALIDFQRQGLDLAVLLNNSCFQMQLGTGNSLWEAWNVPCVNILVDHPMYYFDTLDQAPATGIVACADRYHTDYIRRFYPTVRKSVFLPTAGECLHPFEDLKPFDKRSIDVLFIGSYKYHHDVVSDKFSVSLTETLINSPSLTFEQAVEQCLLKGGRKTESENELKLLIQKYRFIDVNVTAHFRAEIIRTLVESGIEVTVYGNGWDSLDIFHNPYFKYKGLISPAEGIELMGNSKIVLNHMAWFKAGASERIFEAMLQGAVALTDDSEYLAEHFTDQEDIALYSLENLNLLPRIVGTLLGDENLADIIRRNSYQKALDKHTWKERAKNLLSIDS